MSTYWVERKELHSQTVEVEAENINEAFNKVVEGAGEEIGASTFVYVIEPEVIEWDGHLLPDPVWYEWDGKNSSEVD